MENYNVYLRKDGRYEGRVYKTDKVSGKRSYVSYYGHTVEEVIEKIKNDRIIPIYSETKLTIKTLIYEWLLIISSRIKESTEANYRMKAEKHLIPYFGDMLCSSLKSKEIYSFIEKKSKDGLSVRYISDILVLLKTIFKYACREYNIKNVIDGIIMPKKPKAEVSLLDNEDQKKLKNYLRINDGKTSLGISVALYTGMRIGEICALRWKDIDLENGIITISKTIQRIQCNTDGKKTKLVITEPKSESSKRKIPIPECLFKTLKNNKNSGDYFILSDTNKPVEPRTMQYRFASVLKKIGAVSVHFHSLRHLFATRCIALGFDVKTLSEILGHSSIELTLSKYGSKSNRTQDNSNSCKGSNLYD